MAVVTTQYFSAVTASIVIEDIGEVGQLQNVSIEETFDVRPVPEIGNTNVSVFVPGVFKGMLRAQRGLLDLDLIYQKLVPASDTNALKGLIDVVLSSSKSATLSLNGTVESIFNETIKENKLPFTITFAVELKDNSGNVFMRLEDCIINTRRITVNIGQVLVIQDLEILYRKRSK